MAKSTSRKHGTHKKTRAHHAAKPHARRPNASKSANFGAMSPVEAKPEAEIIDDESSIRSDPRISEVDLDDEAGIYGPNRGETAG